MHKWALCESSILRKGVILMAIDVTKDGKYVYSFDGNFYVSLQDYEKLLKELEALKK